MPKKMKRFNAGVDVERDEEFARKYAQEEEKRKTKEKRIVEESKTIPMEFTNIRLTEDLVTKY